MPKSSKNVSTLKVRDRAGGGNGGEGGTCPPPALFVQNKRKNCFPKIFSYIHGREKRRYNCSWKDAIIIVIVKAIK